MKPIQISILFFIIAVFYNPVVWSQDASSKNNSAVAATMPALDEIIARVEDRYAGPGFTARFFQTSILKAIEVTDTASGQIFVKRPGMMRWEYEHPEQQTIVTDGKTLWIYRPEDHQVMIGKAPTFFGDGKGAGFLSDIRQIQNQFLISLENRDPNGDYRLKLFPVEKTFDIALITLTVSARTFDIINIITYNAYNDETRIVLSDIQLKPKLDDQLFTFQIPEGVEILYLDE